jgi:hypothetical protein
MLPIVYSLPTNQQNLLCGIAETYSCYLDTPVASETQPSFLVTPLRRAPSTLSKDSIDRL